jgi:hypothetical protein
VCGVSDERPHPAPGDGVSEVFDRSVDYSLRRSPDLMTVTPGAQVRYTCVHRSGRPPTAIGAAGGTHRDAVRWYKFSARALLEETRSKDKAHWAVPLQKGPTGQFHWDCDWKDPPGRYVIGAEITDAGRSTFRFLPQYVEAAGLVVGGSLDSLLKGGHGPSPAEAEGAIKRQIDNLKAIEKKFPIADPDDRRRHEDTIARWQKAQNALRGLLAPSQGKTRIPVKALHLETASQDRRPLLLFLCHVGDETVGRAARKRPRWVLVDWTDPTDTRFHGTYEGIGDTPDEAIRNALADWDAGNRYPVGRLSYELPAHAFGQAHRREFATDGKTLGDEIKGVFEWIAIGGLVVAGALLLFTPVPALASAALGTSMLSSTAAATISISQRWRAGIFDWREDAFDGLTIVSNVFAAGSAWARGARVLMQAKSGQAVTRIFVGVQLGADAVQGVLIAEQSIEEWTALAEAPGLLPEDRERRLRELMRGLTISGLLTYVSLRASKREMEHLNEKPRHVPNEGQARPIADKIADLTNRSATVDTTKPKHAEGHTDLVVNKTEAPVGSTARPGNQSASETEFAKKYPPDSTKWVRHRFTGTEILLEDVDGFVFYAECSEGGGLSASVFTKDVKTGKRSDHLRARELFELMYKHFEEVGNPVKYLEGQWIQDNFDTAKAKYDELIAAGMSPSIASKEAVLNALTYLKYHRDRGFTKVVYGEYYKNFFTFKIVKPEDY